MADNVLDPTTAFSQHPTATTLSRAFGNGKQIGFWEFLEQSGNEKRFERFGQAMNGASKLSPPDNIVKGASRKFLFSECWLIVGSL